MEKVFESSINRVLSHMEDKDIATITAFRTDSDLGYSKKDNRNRNKDLESDLNVLGYKGYVKIVGYWDETPDDPNSEPTKEETFLVLNVGNRTFDEFKDDMVGLQLKYDQQGIVIWNHKNHKAYLTNEYGKTVAEFNNFNIDLISQAYSKIGNHKLVFSECLIPEDFSDRYNRNGNYMTAMGYQAKRKSLRDNK